MGGRHSQRFLPMEMNCTSLRCVKIQLPIRMEILRLIFITPSEIAMALGRRLSQSVATLILPEMTKVHFFTLIAARYTFPAMEELEPVVTTFIFASKKKMVHGRSRKISAIQ